MSQGTDWWRPVDGVPSRPVRTAASALALAMLAVPLLALLCPALPIALAGSDITGYTGRPVLFEGVGTPDPTLRIILYEWDFDGDGTYDWNSTLGGSTTHVFTAPLNATATFRVTEYNDATGLVTATDGVKVRILDGRPVGSIKSSTTAQVDTPFELRADFYDPDGGEPRYHWDLNDGTTSEQQVFMHSFREVRTYNITLTVTDDENERVHTQLILRVVKELPAEHASRTPYLVGVGAGIGLAIVAAVIWMSMRSSAPTARPKAKKATGPGDVAEEGPAPIMPEARLDTRQAEAPTRRRPKVVSPHRAVKATSRVKEAEAVVPAAPARLPCPECGTTLGEDGTCPFCTSNEAIDAVERRVGDLKNEGYVLAEVEDRLEAAKSALHVKTYAEVRTALEEARRAIDDAVADHERGVRLLALVDELMEEARNRDIDTSKAANLLKLARSFLKSGKYPKAIHYAERSRDFLLEALEPFDLDRYFCTRCKEEVGVEDERCPKCDTPLESGLVKRARRELHMLRHRFDSIGRDHKHYDAIAAHLDQAREHVDSRASAAAKESLERARTLLEETAPQPVEARPEETRPTPAGEATQTTEAVAERAPEGAAQGTAEAAAEETARGTAETAPKGAAEGAAEKAEEGTKTEPPAKDVGTRADGEGTVEGDEGTEAAKEAPPEGRPEGG